jgi:hypothetical protein
MFASVSTYSIDVALYGNHARQGSNLCEMIRSETKIAIFAVRMHHIASGYRPRSVERTLRYDRVTGEKRKKIRINK